MLTRIKHRLKRLIPYYRQVHCPICGNYDHAFLPYGLVPRGNARCPDCGSLERHRLVWRFLQEHSDLLEPRPRKMLHVAPEPCLSDRFRRLGHLDYLTADLYPSAMVVMDITDIQYPDHSFDIVYCSHVLEHVPDDRKAMREFWRVLKPGGWAVLLVPIDAEATFEDPTVTDPKERERVFGQSDHVRIYGPDFADRLTQAGFLVRTVTPIEVTGAESLSRMAVPAHEAPIFYCAKRIEDLQRERTP